MCYRGTQPEDVISLLTDADASPEVIDVNLDGARHSVHAGFYRNMRATRYLVIQTLMQAIEGYSIYPTHPDAKDKKKLSDKEPALYITGHSLGGAMAALMGVALVCTPEYEEIAKKLRAVYTFGQPMPGDKQFAQACESHADSSGEHFLRDNVIRYIFDRDVVPHLPPRPVGPYAPFGREFHLEKHLNWFEESASLVGDVLDDVVSLPGDAVQTAREALKVPAKLAHDGIWATASEGIRQARSKLWDTALGEALSARGNGQWTERFGEERARQVQNLAGLTVVAPAAYLAARLDVTRDIPFKYSFEDHAPTHYVSTLAAQVSQRTGQEVRSEFGDVL